MAFEPVLGLDLGLTTLGISVSRSGHLATGLVNLHFHNGKFDYAIGKVLGYVKDERIAIVVLGKPAYPSGDPTQMTFVAVDFAKKLREALDQAGFKSVAIEFQDERDSTLDAAKDLHSLNMNAKRQKPIIDEQASKVILERWLRNKGYDVW